MFFVALVAALLLAAAFNFAGTRYWEGYPVWGGPLAEEVAKTVSAIAIGVPVVSLHLLFGIAEVFWDLGGGGKFLPSLFSVVLHAVFGFTTFWVWYLAGHWVVGLLAAAILHTLWNLFLARRHAT